MNDLMITHGATWNVFLRSGRASDGPWEIESCGEAIDDPDAAARVVCARRWTAGKHRVLVVGPEFAYEYLVTLETEAATPDA